MGQLWTAWIHFLGTQLHIRSLFKCLNLYSHHNIAPRVIFDQNHCLLRRSKDIADNFTAQIGRPISVLYLILPKLLSFVLLLELIHRNWTVLYDLFWFQLQLMDKPLTLECLLKLKDFHKLLIH